MRKLVLLTLTLGSLAAFATRAPLPAELMQARTVYIQNYSGQARRADGCYGELQKWARFKVVSDPKGADLVFRLNVRRGRATLDVIQASTGKMLWSDTSAWSIGSVVKELKGRIAEQELADGTLAK
jgi:hypothetical protein